VVKNVNKICCVNCGNYCGETTKCFAQPQTIIKVSPIDSHVCKLFKPIKNKP